MMRKNGILYHCKRALHTHEYDALIVFLGIFSPSSIKKGAYCMDARIIVITKTDQMRLLQLLDNPVLMRERGAMRDLVTELNRARIVSPREIPADIVTMRSRVRIKDCTTNEESVLTLVFPNEANLDDGKISILAPIGIALLGYRAGDRVEWTVPAGPRSIEILEIMYQPEAAGDYHL
jgi:regulator of nucleoside diphosphate kinase